MIDVWRVKTRWRFEFVKLVADKVTASSVFINGRRASKVSDGIVYFDCFDTAKNYAKSWLERKIDQSKFETSRAEDDLRMIDAMSLDDVPVAKSIY